MTVKSCTLSDIGKKNKGSCGQTQTCIIAFRCVPIYYEAEHTLMSSLLYSNALKHTISIGYYL